MLQHNVYFYLKDTLTMEEIETFEKGINSLLEIDELVEGFVGVPALTDPRPVIDTQYAYALSTVFEDVNQHDRYQVHPIHQKFISACKDFWKEVKVYDVEY